MADVAKIVDELSNLTVLEAADLVKQLEEKWGVEAAAPMAAVAAAPATGGGGEAAPAAEEKDSFDIVLAGFDAAKKIAIIKEVRGAVPGLGLADAKKLVESAPQTIKEGASKDEANEIKKKLEDAGAKVELK